MRTLPISRQEVTCCSHFCLGLPERPVSSKPSRRPLRRTLTEAVGSLIPPFTSASSQLSDFAASPMAASSRPSTTMKDRRYDSKAVAISASKYLVDRLPLFSWSPRPSCQFPNTSHCKVWLPAQTGRNRIALLLGLVMSPVIIS